MPSASNLGGKIVEKLLNCFLLLLRYRKKLKFYLSLFIYHSFAPIILSLAIYSMSFSNIFFLSLSIYLRRCSKYSKNCIFFFTKVERERERNMKLCRDSVRNREEITKQRIPKFHITCLFIDSKMHIYPLHSIYRVILYIYRRVCVCVLHCLVVLSRIAATQQQQEPRQSRSWSHGRRSSSILSSSLCSKVVAFILDGSWACQVFCGHCKVVAYFVCLVVVVVEIESKHLLAIYLEICLFSSLYINKYMYKQICIYITSVNCIWLWSEPQFIRHGKVLFESFDLFTRDKLQVLEKLTEF